MQDDYEGQRFTLDSRSRGLDLKLFSILLTITKVKIQWKNINSKRSCLESGQKY